MKKILYISHVEWKWIKQRPHFIAEGLADSRKVIFLAPVSILKLELPRKIRNLVIISVPQLPYSRNKIIERLNFEFFKIFTSITCSLYSIEIILYSSGKNFLKSKIQSVYDCMDDMLEFPHVSKLARIQEIKALKNVDLVIFSSQNLQDKFGYITKNSRVINNGFYPYKDISKIHSKYDATYIGTISKWMDWDTVLSTFNGNTGLSIEFYGPCEHVPKIASKQIKFHGVIAHDKVPSIIAGANSLVMPFQINELIKSVDPVKVYEYIAFSSAKIVLPYYQELDKFSDYVHFYSSSNEMAACLTHSLDKISGRKNWSEKHTWAIRVSEFIEVIDG